ncbi:glycoside hydrolase superfamily [Syncephalastrum racemosum]|uniref:non-reducing end alpha-L-arabinofuranosidase n=1 Tax=Syncephalastrum racemosum TaxID=13706 RepID=A0A1X2HIV1_SYNRA|nr:glycoside hydrolase superfamily [Syncephalastrum racemosum]
MQKICNSSNQHFSTISLLLSSAALVSSLSLTIRNDVAGNSSSTYLYGIMFEDITRSGDSGLYANMLRNWNFQASDNGSAPTTEFWEPIGAGKISLDAENALNKANPHSLRLDVDEVDDDGRAGIANMGWWGLRVQPAEKYTASFFAKSDSYSGALNVTLEKKDGTVLASQTVKGLSEEYKQFSVSFPSTSASNVSTDNVFAVSVASPEAKNAVIHFSVFSLFGETYKGRENGVRKDIAEAWADLNPRFFRFPGGNNLEGESIDTRWKWNETVGPLEERIGRMGDWGYWNTNGQGLLDFMYLCEDMNMEPLLGVYDGYSLDKSSVAEEDLEPYVQEVLNELEYLTGDASTKYGAMRASHGRKEPFKLKYIEIGNEDFFSTTTGYRYKAYYDAISAKYPDLVFIESGLQDSAKVDILDDHYYKNHSYTIELFDKYDNYPRNNTAVVVTEYALHRAESGDPYKDDLESALANGVFITGLERNSDFVKMMAYAPTIAREEANAQIANLFYFDTESIWLTPSYYIVKEWGTHRSDTILQVDASNGGFKPLYWVVGSNKEKNEIYVKMINIGESEQNVSFDIKGASVSKSAIARVVSGQLHAQNSKTSSPVKTVEQKLELNSTSSFDYTFAAYSATVLVLSLN